MLTISVKNFGPIAEGSVDLKPLTIFVGPSNTGKSYMATAVYAVMRSVEGRPQVPYTQHLERRGLATGYTSQWEVPAEVTDAIREWIKQQDGTAWVDQEIPESAMPEEARSELRQSTVQVLEWLHRDITQQLILAYRGDSELVRKGSEPRDFLLRIRRNLPLLELDIVLSDGKRAMPNFDITTASAPSNIIEHWGSGQHLDEEIFPGVYESLFSQLRISAAESLFDGLPYRSFFLPAARSGIAQAQKILAASIIRQSSLLGSARVNIPALPGVTTEFLSDLVSPDRSMGSLNRNIALHRAISFIETNVLHGEIDLDESAGLPYPEVAYRTETGEFALEHSSSMVTELAPVILFLKYLIGPGDLLIFEEPESHLHPAAQRQLARGIVRLVNAGVRVLITTHSETFVSQINHLLRISYASKRWLKEHNFQPEDCIGHEQVAAYQFGWDEQQRGSVVKPLEIRKDIGISEDEFIGVIDSLYEESHLVQRIRVKQ